MDEKLLKPIPEVTYLTTGNSWRYRSILRYFYAQYERLRHYLFPEEVLEFLNQSIHFLDYTEEQLQQDLNQLVEWKNLIPRQDMTRVTSVEEFKKKKFRYQCTPYTVEIERMVQGLEQMGDSFGGSLEKTLFDRLLNSLFKILGLKADSSQEQKKEYQVDAVSNEELYSLWDEMYDNFRKLTEGATDYLAHLQSEKVEEIMMTEAFLAYKDAITDYLRNFMTALQRTSFRIENLLRDCPESLIIEISGRLADYDFHIPRLDERPGKEELAEKYLAQWKDLTTWFLGHEGSESDLIYLQNVTNETIRRITRFAQRLGERHHTLKSRRHDYLFLADWFAKCLHINEAHEISACVFGVFYTRHLYAGGKETEDIYAEIWEEEPTEITVKPRVRNYREKTRPGAINSHSREKQQTLEKYLREREAEQKLIEQIVEQNRIVLAELPVVDPYIRKTLLHWIGKCMTNNDKSAKTETGRKFQLIKLDNGEITLHAEDGVMRMPNFAIQFLE
jgi:uncharacterized protein (TIGR02677 family)